MSEFLDQDASSQLVALASKRISAVELLKLSLARHAETHADLNAVVAADPERALERARALDDARLRGEPMGPLAGLPMTIKDTFDVAGMAASSGLADLRRRMTEDAAAVSHARRAGAVIWGKTNVPVMAADWQSANPLYGVTKNPWDPARTPGGSSGGAAAALAARVTPLEIGSDIGGSLRVPAGFCGVFSHKPTWGMVSQRGHVPPSPGSFAERDLNVIGPMARSARDLRLLLSIIENGPLAPKAPAADLKETRIGLWLDDPMCPLDPEVRAVIQTFADELRAAGAEVETIPSPVDMRALLHAYQTLLGAVLGEDLPPAMLRGMERVRFFAKGALARGAGPFSSAAMAMAYTARHTEWLAADAVRARLRHEIDAAFGRWNVILAPISPVAAFPHDKRPFQKRKLTMSNGQEIPYPSMLTWISVATALRLPATAVPAGLTTAGLPVGVQLIGPLGGDARTLAVAQAIDENVRGFVAPEL
ncbi:MAG: amidase [Alphaproteobacteria bacterium]|nr:amidase [Alphaproteobacteria bacterium]MBU1514239.1 amidase [Alphaproteobacteria bacterium]MBU2093315.1 amidase [Alphaproteobacteria bacterium]MBU2153406.1 amidase [Alphaproteobacteria bacterium]MBU2307097.1 amidase [Alphaproteobacteria bacterium]